MIRARPEVCVALLGMKNAALVQGNLASWMRENPAAVGGRWQKRGLDTWLPTEISAAEGEARRAVKSGWICGKPEGLGPQSGCREIPKVRNAACRKKSAGWMVWVMAGM